VAKFLQYSYETHKDEMKTKTKPNIRPSTIAMALFWAVAVLAPTSTITITKTKSQALAVLRPLFPVKPSPPFGGEVIATGDDLTLGSSKEHQKKTEVRNEAAYESKG
jgi:hypothetical protein